MQASVNYAIILPANGVLFIGPLKQFSAIWIELPIFSYIKMHVKMSSTNSQPLHQHALNLVVSLALGQFPTCASATEVTLQYIDEINVYQYIDEINVYQYIDEINVYQTEQNTRHGLYVIDTAEALYWKHDMARCLQIMFIILITNDHFDDCARLQYLSLAADAHTPAILPGLELVILYGHIRGPSLRWRHNERDDVSNHRRLDCLLNRLFRRRSKNTSMLRATGLCLGKSPVKFTRKGPITRNMFPFNDTFMSIKEVHHDTGVDGIDVKAIKTH